MSARPLVIFGLLAGCGPLSGGTPYGEAQEAMTICASGSTVGGVDISHLQGTIDWAQVAAAGRRFVVMKATEGLTYTDPDFATNWPGSKAAGLYRAPYHFFRPQDDGVQQAMAFLAVTGTDFTGDLPPMLDLEVTDNQSAAVVLQRASDWMTTVAAQTGKTPALYTFPSFWNATLGNPSSFTQYPLWIANYGVSCPDVPGAWTRWAIWQDSATGTVAGINGQVDTDQFQGTEAQLAAWANGSSTPPDAGTTPDAGSVHDAGTALDAGTEPDAGATVDAGEDDAGSATLDAGPAQVIDGGGVAVPSVTADAGGSPPVTGGCAAVGGPFSALALIALSGLRRPRRSAPRRRRR